MTARHLYPTLGQDGWVRATVKTADYILSHFFLAEYSQTAEFTGRVSSFPWIMSKNQRDLDGLKRDTREALAREFGYQFDNVIVEVTESPEPDSVNLHSLTIFLEFTDMTGKVHNLSRMVRHNLDKVTEIIDLNNG